VFAVPDNTVALPAAPGSAHPARLAIEFARHRDRWVSLLRYDPDERFAALVHTGADHEVWLLSWLPGQHTGVHDHGVASGAFTVVTGSLTETVSRTGGVTAHVVTEGRTRVFGPGYTHQVRNLGPDPAVSVHVYRPARP
jgi:predicted metal-dependent enzyme (double-stranded beta helix superfamily)